MNNPLITIISDVILNEETGLLVDEHDVNAMTKKYSFF